MDLTLINLPEYYHLDLRKNKLEDENAFPPIIQKHKSQSQKMLNVIQLR